MKLCNNSTFAVVVTPWHERRKNREDTLVKAGKTVEVLGPLTGALCEGHACRVQIDGTINVQNGKGNNRDTFTIAPGAPINLQHGPSGVYIRVAGESCPETLPKPVDCPALSQEPMFA